MGARYRKRSRKMRQHAKAGSEILSNEASVSPENALEEEAKAVGDLL